MLSVEEFSCERASWNVVDIQVHQTGNV